MFYLKRKGNGDGNLKNTSNEDDFGWWLSDPDVPNSPRSFNNKDVRSSASSSSSSSSMLSCIDSDDTDNYALAEDFKHDSSNSFEKIELTSLAYEDLDVDLIEKDAATKNPYVTPIVAEEATEQFDKSESRSEKCQAMCYTPERLVRSQEYRILTPSPRYLPVSQIKITPENENLRKSIRCRRRLNYLIDSNHVGATQLKAVLNLDDPHYRSKIYKPVAHDIRRRSNHKNANSIALDKSGSISKCSSYEKLNVTWEEFKKPMTRSSSLEDTSGIQSNDWSSDTQSEVQNTPLCLCDELASANFRPNFSQERGTAINEVASILDVLETEPNKAAVLLEEDRFCKSTSSHDQLTRLALAIETDANVPGVPEDPENFVQRFQKKLKKLQDTSNDIYRDIRDLRKNFEYDEQKMENISSDTTRLREDIHEMRYLDDLLNLLRGELDRISKRNWPFVIGRAEHHSEEMNLII